MWDRTRSSAGNTPNSKGKFLAEAFRCGAFHGIGKYCQGQRSVAYQPILLSMVPNPIMIPQRILLQGAVQRIQFESDLIHVGDNEYPGGTIMITYHISNSIIQSASYSDRHWSSVSRATQTTHNMILCSAEIAI